MYSSDLNTNIAVEHRAEQMRAVRKVGQLDQPQSAARTWSCDVAPRNSSRSDSLTAGLVMAVLTVVLLLVVASNTGGAGGLVVALVH